MSSCASIIIVFNWEYGSKTSLACSRLPMVAEHNTIADYIGTHLKNGSSIAANVNGSVTPVEFMFSPLRSCRIRNMIISIGYPGTAQSGLYGALPALANGVDFFFKDVDDTEIDLLNGDSVKNNIGWAELAIEYREQLHSGGGDKAIICKWRFSDSGIDLYLTNGQSLVVRVNDDLTALSRHHFYIEGRYL